MFHTINQNDCKNYPQMQYIIDEQEKNSHS
uniref:Uncharacterized protein n=1 Tax=Strongyloides papillosus TaxID=174720 RepID=A0A0N5BP06_STREA